MARRHPRATPELSDIVFIKPVVAGPGDTIAFRDGVVVRNGRPVSRFWGPVPTKAITGVVKYRYWPLKDAGRL